MRKFILLMVLFAAGCMTAAEKDCPEPEVRTVYDTVTVTKRDTVKVTQKDTVRVVERDTIRIYDTVKVLANASQPDDLFGTWEGASGSQKVTIAFTSSLISEADFSATLGAVAGNGYLKSIENGQAKVVHGGFKDATWLMSLKDGFLTIEEIGTKFFAGAITTLRKR